MQSEAKLSIATKMYKQYFAGASGNFNEAMRQIWKFLLCVYCARFTLTTPKRHHCGYAHKEVDKGFEPHPLTEDHVDDIPGPAATQEVAEAEDAPIQTANNQQPPAHVRPIAFFAHHHKDVCKTVKTTTTNSLMIAGVQSRSMTHVDSSSSPIT